MLLCGHHLSTYEMSRPMWVIEWGRGNQLKMAATVFDSFNPPHCKPIYHFHFGERLKYSNRLRYTCVNKSNFKLNFDSIYRVVHWQNLTWRCECNEKVEMSQYLVRCKPLTVVSAEQWAHNQIGGNRLTIRSHTFDRRLSDHYFFFVNNLASVENEHHRIERIENGAGHCARVHTIN